MSLRVCLLVGRKSLPVHWLLRLHPRTYLHTIRGRIIPCLLGIIAGKANALEQFQRINIAM